MRFAAIPFTKMLSSIVDAESRLRNLTLVLFTWRTWTFRETDVERWDAADVALLRLSKAMRERFEVSMVTRIVANQLEYGPHDIRVILPRMGEQGLVQLVRSGDSTSELSS